MKKATTVLMFFLLVLSVSVMGIPRALSTTYVTMRENFEGVFPRSNWHWLVGDRNLASGSDYWGVSTYRFHGGSRSGWCAQVGAQSDTGQLNSVVHRYDNNMDAFMTTSAPSIYDPYGGPYGGWLTLTSISLSFYYWTSCATNDYLEVYTADRFNDVSTVKRYSGNSGGWQRSTLSIPPTGVWDIGFSFHSDSSIHNYGGAYLDDIVLTMTVAGWLFSDSFESNSFLEWSGTRVTLGETATVVNTRFHHGSYSAKFTSNGGGGIEAAYCYETVPSSTELYARGYYYVSRSGIVDNNDRFFFIKFRAGTNNIAYAGWRKINGVVRWCLTIRHGTGYVNIYSSASPSLYRWYRVELHWRKGLTTGMGELFVNGVRVCSTTLKNTATYGNANFVSFGLAEMYGCTSTTIYGDCCAIATHYIGTLWG